MAKKDPGGFLCKGANWFQVEPGTVDHMRCPVCRAECTLERNVHRFLKWNSFGRYFSLLLLF